MAAGPVGTSWAPGSWPDTAWEAGSWADGSDVPAVLGDLTTLFVGYVQDLRDTSALAVLDSDTLVSLDRPNVAAAVPGEVDDANTMYARFLS